MTVVRSLALGAVLVLFAGGLYLAVSRGSGRSDPSVLLVVIDTLRADRLGLYGYHRPTSPRLDQFATGALVYETAVSPAPFTMPAMAALMTGYYPDRVGVVSHTKADRLRGEEPTVGELLERAGYTTAAVVTNPWLSMRPMRYHRGFRHFVARRALSKKRGRVTAATVTDRGLELIDGARSKPFFVWLHYMDTHMPYRPRPLYLEQLGDTGLESSIVNRFKTRRLAPQDLYFARDLDPRDVDATQRLYDATVRQVDDQVGRLLDGLSERGLADETIVIVVSDHGESLGDHGLNFAHDFTLYEELVHVPLIVRLPGVAASRINTPVSLIDVMPTLCTRLSLECESDLPGRALPHIPDQAGADRTLFAAAAPARKRYAANPWSRVEGIDGRWTMARTRHEKVIKIPHPDGPVWEAYDLELDPLELDNLGEEPAFGLLRARLLSWEEETRRSRLPRGSDAAAIDGEDLEDLRSFGYLH